MKFILFPILTLSTLMAGTFTLESNDLEGQLTKVQEFNGFGCNGENKSPELHWTNAPKGTKSFALTVYDPDAPTGSGWWHWLVINIPSKITTIKTNASALKALPKGALETLTDYGKSGFGGACPPKGDKPHAYLFTLYALDTDKLEVKETSDSALVGYMINSHTLEKTTLISYYGRE
jgi:hypothetical protein